MPQMAPMNWLMLFISFFTILILTSNLIYFMFIKNNKINLKKNNQKKNYYKSF